MQIQRLLIQLLLPFGEILAKCSSQLAQVVTPRLFKFLADLFHNVGNLCGDCVVRFENRLIKDLNSLLADQALLLNKLLKQPVHLRRSQLVLLCYPATLNHN